MKGGVLYNQKVFKIKNFKIPLIFKGNIWGAFERVETQEEVVFINRIKAWAFPTR